MSKGSNKNSIAVKILAAVLAGVMVLGMVAGTIIYFVA